jgi:hypothetical protein
MNSDDNSRISGQIIGDIDVHQGPRGIVSKAGYFLKRTRGDSLADILS